jgi:small-conductance mechanosensitive channel
MIEWLDPLLDWVSRLSPSPYLRALAVIVLFLLLAKLIDLLVSAAVGRFLQHWAGSRREDALHLGHRTVFRTVALVGLGIATTIIDLAPRAETITLAVVNSILILVWVTAGIRAGAMLIHALSHRVSPPAWARPTTAPLLNNSLRVVLALAGVYAVLLAWNVNVTGLVASAGIVGLALSFAAQDTLGNLLAGVAILADQPYRIGPHVKYRLRVPVGVAYGSDIDKVMATLMRIAAEHPNVCEAPTPRVRFRSFGESGLEIELLVWIAQPALRGLALHEINCEIYRTFDREGINIPFPQRDLHIRDWRQKQ